MDPSLGTASPPYQNMFPATHRQSSSINPGEGMAGLSTDSTVFPEITTFDSTSMDTNTDSSQPYTTVMTTMTSEFYSQSTSVGNGSDNGNSPINMTHQEIQEYLEHLQNEEFQLYALALVFILILAVVGVFGNILVLMVYKSKFHRTPTRIFILTIAMFDLIANVICIPGDAYDMFYLYNYPSPVLCRLTRYANASTTITSACILLALSVTRYKKICRPFGKQVTTRHAKILSVSTAIFGWAVSIPFGILNGIHTRTTPRSGIFGYECSIDDVYIDTIWPLVNSGFFLLLFLAMCGPLVIFYTLIGIKAFKHSKIHGQSVVNMKNTTTPSCTHTISMTDDNLGKPNKGVLAKLASLKRHKKYKISAQSETLDSQNSESLNSKDCDEGITSKKDKRFGKEKRKGTPADTREDSTNSAKLVRSLSGDKTVVNFSMVRELTVKLKEIKQTDDASSSSSDKETPTPTKESGGGDDGVVVGSNTGQANSNIEAKPQTTQGPNEYDEESTDQCVSKDEMAKPQEAATAADQNQDSGNKGVAFSLNWIDVAYSLHKDNDKNKADKDGAATPSKKSSLSRKVSRENSLLQKHRKIRDALLEKLKRGRQSLKDDEEDDDDSGDDTNDTTDRNEDIREETNIGPPDKSSKNSHTRITEVNVTDQLPVPDSENKNGAQKQHATKTQERGSVINRTTAMLILITSVYVLSYVPYLVLVFFRFTQPDNFEAMGKVSKALHNFFLRTYFVNSAANAIIYSLCDYKFRTEALRFFKCKR